MIFTKRQQNIINASLKIISVLGIQNFTIKNLSNELNVTEGAIYRHFESKEQIITAIIEFTFQFIQNGVAQIMSLPLPPLEKMKLMFTSRAERLMSNRDNLIMNNILKISGDDNNLKYSINKILEFYNDSCYTILSEAQKNGEIRKDINIESLVLIIIGTLHILIEKWERLDFNFNIHEESKELWSSIELLIRP